MTEDKEIENETVFTAKAIISESPQECMSSKNLRDVIIFAIEKVKKTGFGYCICVGDGILVIFYSGMSGVGFTGVDEDLFKILLEDLK